MSELRAWVTAQLLWNPQRDDRALIREHIRPMHWEIEFTGVFTDGVGVDAVVAYLADALKQAGVIFVGPPVGAIEAMGLKPRLVPAGAQNFKVTYPDDFVLAEAVLRSRQ